MPDFIAYAHKVNELFYNKGKYGFTSTSPATEKTYAKFLKEKVNADMQVLEGFNF